MKAQPTFALKDQLVNAKKVELLTHHLKRALPNLKTNTFKSKILKALPNLELKQRLQHITNCLHEVLPESYPQAIKIISKALPPPLDPTLKDDDFGEYIFYPYSIYASKYGNNKKHLNISLKALKEITKRFSAEEAIRIFINQYPNETFDFLATCLKDDNYHVRRWVSEGTRPKLPWAQKITTEIERPLSFLDQLYHDSTRYVTRSVANHLNDISKTHPELVIQKLQQWQNENKQNPKEFEYICKHSLRTLLKQGNQGALEFLGFPNNPKVKLSQFWLLSKTIKVNTCLDFSFQLESSRSEKLMIDYSIENNQKKNKKVFKIKQLELAKNTPVQISKSHPFKLMTTRSLHAGEHRLAIHINGKIFHEELFELKLS